MKHTRIVATRYRPDVLHVVEEDCPEPMPGDVRVKVLAAGVALPDVMTREGKLGRLAGLDMYGTCSSRGASAVSDLGGIPVDYQTQDFVTEIHRLTGDGVDVVFESIGGTHIWRSRKALRRGGTVVAYGLFDLLHENQIAPLIAQRFPLAEARQAHELLGEGGVTGKIVLVANQQP